MDGAEVLDIARAALSATLEASAPALIVALVVGVAIALLQALTQIQEMTLVFVPKIVAIFVTLLIAMPLMGAALGELATRIFERIAVM